MIIDLILDRKDGFTEYKPKEFYNECMEYNGIFKGIAEGITKAMDYGTEEEVKAELCEYIIKNGYNTEICNYVNSVDWLE